MRSIAAATHGPTTVLSVTLKEKTEIRIEVDKSTNSITPKKPSAHAARRHGGPPPQQASQPGNIHEEFLPRDEILLDFELDTQPLPIAEISLDPNNIIPAAIAGRMVLILLISSSGKVLWSHVEYSDFEESTSDQFTSEFEKSEFSPGMKAGRAVSSIIRIEIERTASN